MFFSQPGMMDSLMVNIEAKDLQIQNILESALKGSDYEYIILSYAIIITVGEKIKPGLPMGFFDINSAAPVDLDLIALSFTTGELATNNETEISIEDKLIEIGNKTPLVEGKIVNLAGTIKEELNGEPIVGAIVYIEEPRIGGATDAFGFYNIALPQGRHTLKMRSVGMKETKREIMLFSEGS